QRLYHLRRALTGIRGDRDGPRAGGEYVAAWGDGVVRDGEAAHVEIGEACAVPDVQFLARQGTLCHLERLRLTQHRLQRARIGDDGDAVRRREGRRTIGM